MSAANNALEARTERSEATKILENAKPVLRNLSGSASLDRPLGNSLLRKVRALEGHSYSNLVDNVVARRLLPLNGRHDPPCTTVVAVLAQINALPGPQRQPPGPDRDC